MKALGYVRLSQMDESTTSPQRQRQAIRQWCDERGVTLVATLEDLERSAFDRRVRRPGYEQLLRRLGEVDTVVVWRLDRLVRTVSGFATLLERLERTGTKLATTDGSLDMTTAAGRFTAGIMAGVAELESATTSERARAMHAYKASRGEWVGRIPRGFRLEGKHLVVDPESFATIEEVAERYVGGESLRAISSDVGIHHPNLAATLRSDRVLEHLRPALRSRLVSELAERGRTGSRAKRSLLGGIARCGLCGAGMTVYAESSTSGWAAYACRQRRHSSISRGWLDSYVSDEVVAAIDTGQLLARIERARGRRRSLTAAEIEGRLEMLERDFYEGTGWTRERFLARREGLLRQLESARRTEADAGIDLAPELAAHLRERWPDLSVLGRRRIVAAVVERIDVAKATSRGRIDPARVSIVWR